MATIVQVDRAERRFNCRNPRCGGFVWMPDSFGYSGDPYETFECPACSSVYALAGEGSGPVVPVEISVIQTEFDRVKGRRGAPRPKRPEIYADPLLGPIRRAQDRARAAEQSLGQALADAIDAGMSYRQVALAAGLSKSAVHRMVQAASAHEVGVAGSLPPIPVLDTDEIVF